MTPETKAALDAQAPVAAALAAGVPQLLKAKDASIADLTTQLANAHTASDQSDVVAAINAETKVLSDLKTALGL